MDLEIVVARFREELAWTGNVAPGVTLSIYDKSGDPTASGIPLPNTGREAHTYLHHIITRYDSLADVTLFCQGKPFDHEPALHKIVRRLISGEETITDFRWLGFLIDTDDARGRRLFTRWSKNPEGRELPLDELYRALFHEEPPAEFTFHGGAQFLSTRELIRRQPRAFYERALALSMEIPDAAHGFERIWDRVFGVRGVDPELVKNGTPVYLKPIRRLMAD